MVRLRRLRGQVPGPTILVALAATLSAALAGCATAPSGGAPRQAPGANSQVQAYVQPLPPPGPTINWSAQEVVLGFLHASASYAFDPAAAGRFLTPALRKQWHPGRGPVVVVRDTTTSVSAIPFKIVGPTMHTTLVNFGHPLARLSPSGQYESAPDQTVGFVLVQIKGVWLIQQFLADPGRSQQALVLTESDFEDVYQPRNLFFFASGAGSPPSGELVPDPVYAPIQSSSSALNSDIATGLVNGLLNPPGGWLDGVTTTAFPAGTKLLKNVTINGKIAQVDLGGAAAGAQSAQLGKIALQLEATLSDQSDYSRQQLASTVQLSINHKWKYLVVVGEFDNPNLIPAVPSGSPLQLMTGSSFAQWRGSAKLQPRPGPSLSASAPVTAIASSPAPDHALQLAVAVQYGGGCAVYEQPAGQGLYRAYPLTTSGGTCDSLSYDADGNLWVAAGRRVWVLRPGGGPVAVSVSNLSGAIQPGDRILGLRIAPDAVRAALVIGTGANNRLLLSTVHFGTGTVWFGQVVPVGSGLSDNPIGVSWYNPYYLAVLTGAGIYSVPLTTGAGQQPSPQLLTALPSGVDPVTITTDQTELVVGTKEGVFAKSLSAPTPGWTKVANRAADPAYPG